MTTILQKYARYLPLTLHTPLITLGEGNTPLVKSVAIGTELGCDLYFKLEGNNPTGSFKDRGMVVAIAKALEAGKKRIICASTGNTSASAAAYGARFGLATDVIVPQGKISAGKLVQAQIYGARVIEIKGNFDQALQLVRSAVQKIPEIEMVNSLNPHRIAGQTTAAFEICEQLEKVPDIHCIPVGNAGNITAYWRGYKTLLKHGVTKSAPVMHGFQAAGAAPIVIGKPVPNPETFATAIRIGNPASWKNAERARDESGGSITACAERQIEDAYHLLPQAEGVFAEPASAISVAGLLQLARNGFNLRGKTVVCTLTGNGLKDPSAAPTKKMELIDPSSDDWLERLWRTV